MANKNDNVKANGLDVAVSQLEKQLWALLIAAICFLGFLPTYSLGETLYVSGKRGDDSNSGTLDRPFRTLGQAAMRVNGNSEAGPTTIRVAPGIYCLDRAVVFKNNRPYSKKDRLTIEAQYLPDDPQWRPALMPSILSVEDPKEPGKRNRGTETYSIQIKLNHVTIRGMRFLGNPSFNNMHAVIARNGPNLKDLIVAQCTFIGDRNGLDVYCPVIGTGDELVVEHCIFLNCNASAVFWDGLDGIAGKRNAMRYCIVYGGLISGVWTCQTSNDFEFHHNVIANCDYFWMRKPGDAIPYTIYDSVVVGNRHYSGYGNAGGASGETGDEVTFKEEGIIKDGKVTLVMDERDRYYLHIVPGTPGSDLGAGLFGK